MKSKSYNPTYYIRNDTEIQHLLEHCLYKINNTIIVI